MVKVEHLSKYYDDNPAVEDLNFELYCTTVVMNTHIKITNIDSILFAVYNCH